MVFGTIFVVVPGCGTTHVVSVDADGTPQYGELTIVYELLEPTVAAVPGSSIDLAYTKAHPLRAALVSHQADGLLCESTAVMRLTVQCPVPSDNHETGLVTLSSPIAPAGEWRTVAERLVSRTEVNLLMSHLACGGICDSETRPTGNARISIEIDGHRIEKPWTREPRLDRLLVDTYDAHR